MNLSKEEANRRLEVALERIDELETELQDKDYEIEELQYEILNIQDEYDNFVANTKSNDTIIYNELLVQMKKDCLSYVNEFEDYLDNQYFRFYDKGE